MAFRLSMSPMREISSNMFNEFFFFISGSAAVGVSPLESADPGGVRRAGLYKDWVLGVPFFRGVGFRVLGGGGLGAKIWDLRHFGDAGCAPRAHSTP